MNHKRFILVGLLLAVFATAGAVLAQRGGGRQRDRMGDDYGGIDGRYGVPMWENDEHFKNDIFTFARVIYNAPRSYEDDFGGFGGLGGFGGGSGRRGRGGGGRGGGGRGGGRWATDYPQADLNFSFRLQQLTTMKVNPNPVALQLTDEDLFDYPFLYMVEVGDLFLSEPDVVALRRYLLNGGFLMVDDFWGDYAWDVFYSQIKRVFPDREPQDLSIDHEIFRCVYKLKEFPQVPSFRSTDESLLARGITWERGHGAGSETPHFRALFDDKGRMMAIICHNTDLGDGWEREGTSEFYFHNFCENKSYPMGINIVTYALTH
jgi:hypothetical protein